MVYRQGSVNFGICGEEAMILVYKFDIFEIFSNFENENQILVYKENPCKIWYIIRKKNFGIRRKSINFGIYHDPSVFWYAANKSMYFDLHRHNLVFVRLAVRLAMRACCWIVWFRLVSGCCHRTCYVIWLCNAPRRWELGR